MDDGFGTLLTQAELAAALRVHRSSIHRWTVDRRIPVLSVAGTRRYSLEAVRLALSQDADALAEVEPLDEVGDIPCPPGQHHVDHGVCVRCGRTYQELVDAGEQLDQRPEEAS